MVNRVTRDAITKTLYFVLKCNDYIPEFVTGIIAAMIYEEAIGYPDAIYILRTLSLKCLKRYKNGFGTNSRYCHVVFSNESDMYKGMMEETPQ